MDNANGNPLGRRAGRAGATAVVGLQWGDEGKGKVVDLLASEADAVVRYNGGANAGHSVVIDGKRYALHLTPSGILHPGVLAVIGNGVVADHEGLLQELTTLDETGIDTSGLRISNRAHVVTRYHFLEDAAREALLRGDVADKSIGTTLRGIGPAYSDKALRTCALRFGDLLNPKTLREKLDYVRNVKSRTLPAFGHHVDEVDHDAMVMALEGAGERLGSRIVDTAYLLHELLADGKRLLFEGANGTLLDVDHGSYPFVTSSNSSTLGIGPGTGVSCANLGRVLGVLKAYSTRVGAGPMPTELTDETADRIRERGREFGTTTGRPRRVGWLDLVAARYAVMINGCTEVALTLLDVLSGIEELHVCVKYDIDGTQTERFPADAARLQRARPVYETLPGFDEELSDADSVDALPQRARAYVEFIQSYIGAPVSIISVGPDRAQTIQAVAV
jgi:adenylosuccinate synthase